MKRLLLIFTFVFLLSTSAVYAKTVKVMALDEFSTSVPSTVFRVKLLESKELGNDMSLKVGTVLSGKVVRVKNARRLKLNGYFEFIPDEIITEDKDEIITNPTIKAKVVGYKPMDPKDVAEQAALAVVDRIIKNASLGISFAKGVITAENENRIKAGITQVYKDSPLSYVEVGSELDVNVGDTLILKTKKFANIGIVFIF